MSKFKHHQEQIHIKDSDFNLATVLKEKYFINNIENRKNSVTELKKLTNILENLNIKCWIDYGTLLGAYRKNKVIKYDHDFDVSILFQRELFNSEVLCQELSENYYIIHHSVDSYICLYPKNNSDFSLAHIDIYFWHVDKRTMQSSTWSSIHTPIYFYDELETIMLEDIEFNCPRHLKQYLIFRYGEDFMIEKEKYSPDKNVVVPKDQYTAYTYGVYDMFHVGHLNLFKRIKDNFSKLIVGVHNDNDVITYKSKPIISYEDRLEIIKSCKYVDEVYENADLVVTNNLLDKLKSDYVVAGRENKEYIKNYYQVDDDKLHLIKRTKNICSSDIKNKILNLV